MNGKEKEARPNLPLVLSITMTEEECVVCSLTLSVQWVNVILVTML